MLDAEGISAHVAEQAGQVVATGFTKTADGYLGVFNVATPPRFRRRGFGRATTRALLNDGYTRGARTAFLSPSAEGRPLYISLGFRTVAHFTRFTRP
ncbi:GNAT family N-acetyltransferase [Actinacidiphila guanduensis]|uniref:GNAT family N-acetyltransferase n=1 Tax=Actinacidiphila guanduensis TaxID=310781 RepID=UPI000B89F7CA|nr:GNAT family N-acetyltransferase [Actinacidiphila guanduensis]